MVWRNIARLSLLLVVFCLVASASPAKKKPPARPVNLNSATSAELQQVPGIGPATAAKILQMRKSYGAFKSVDDLRAIRGIGPKRIEKMRKYLTVGKSPAVKKAGKNTACFTCVKPKSTATKTSVSKASNNSASSPASSTPGSNSNATEPEEPR